MDSHDEILIYRARFEISVDPSAADPSRPLAAPIDMALAAVWRWLTAGGRLARRPELAAVVEAPLAREAFRAGGLELGDGGPLGTVLKTEQYGGDGGEFWAMDYDELAAASPPQRERTLVGLAKNRAGTCAVNIRVARYLPPDVFVKVEPSVRHEAPSYARRMLDYRGYRLSSGSTVLARGARRLTAATFDAEFARPLLDPERRLPLILMVGDWEGELPVRARPRPGTAGAQPDGADELARDLRGLANVYCADWRDDDLRGRLEALFREGTPAEAYLCDIGGLRVYNPSVDLGDAEGAFRHWEFSGEFIRRRCGYGGEHPRYRAFTDLLVKNLSQACGRAEGDVLGPEDVARRRMLSQASRYRGLREDLAAMWALAEEADAARDAAERELRTARTDSERELSELLDDCERLADENERLALELDNARVQLAYAAPRPRGAAGEADVRTRRAARAMEELEEPPTDLEGLLGLAEALWGDRIVVLDEARASARAFKGDLKEEWQIIKSVPLLLHGIYFDRRDTRGRAGAEYNSRSVYELAETESSATMADARLRAMREFTYKGRTVMMAAHIKGKNHGDPDNLFRLHYYVDHEDKVIVIGHCGGHLPTAGTRRI